MMNMDQFLAEIEIAKMLTAYAWALDAKDLESSMSLFTDDVRFD